MDSIISTLDYIVYDFFPALVSRLSSMYIADGVSLLGFSVAVILLSIIIGAVLFRV